MQFPKTSEHLFEMANELGFYSNLIAQLNKDFLLANIDEVFDNNISPNCLKEKVQNIVFELLNSDYDSYLKLLYIVDVSEHKLKRLNGGDFMMLSELICLEILLRVWEKVWYRNHYS